MIEEILRQLEWRGVDCDSFFYRTSAGAEIDLVLEGEMGLVAVEIKQAQVASSVAKVAALCVSCPHPTQTCSGVPRRFEAYAT